MDFKGSWDDHLPLVEFAYNNSYHASIGMPPYEALYGRKCRTPLCWDEVGERKLLGPELAQQTADIVKTIRARLVAAQDRQKKRHLHRRPLLRSGKLVGTDLVKHSMTTTRAESAADKADTSSALTLACGTSLRR